MKRVLAVFGVLLLSLITVLCVNTLRFRSRQVASEPVSISVDVQGAAGRLAGALKFRTVSFQDSAAFDGAEFERLHAYLQATFPRVHQALTRETVNGYSVLYRWTGSDTSLAPFVLMAHQDVVPIEPGTEGQWTHPPWSGTIADGYVWGRGAMDDKGNLVAILEAVEALLSRGFAPKRTVYLAFGHDEEVGGPRGAVRMAETLRSRGVKPWFVVDEGGALVEDMIPGITRPVALIGTAEKGYMTLELSVRVEGGHSSMPPAQTAIGILSEAIGKLEKRPVPGGIREVTGAMLDYLGPEMGFLPRLVMANRWLLGPLVERMFARSPEGNAMLRTTTAPTIFQAGVKENVLPSSARAIVNFRILPGDDSRSVTEHVARVIDDPRVEIRNVPPGPREPTAASSTESESFRLLQRTVRQVTPAALVVPWLVVGGTDARHFTGLTSEVYRVGVLRLGPEDTKRAHGTDERVSVEGYADMVRFFVQLLTNAAL
ncbi:MAG TPA: M20 family peptidase [Gemmatimonadales bacterium]|nr:M20 family peptidase [Gemmatimonadales bacterium]